MNDNNKIALFSLISKSVKIVSGPIVIFVVSSTLEESELAFYYAFFSLVAMQQLLEMGIGHVLRQQIAHSFKLTEGMWSLDSQREIKNYIYFANFWFLCLSLLFFLLVGGGGYVYFSTSNIENINWQEPWLILISTISFFIIFTPISITIESVQRQKVLFKARLLSSIINAVSMIVLINGDYKLYSIGIALFISNLVLYILLFVSNVDIFKKLTIVERTKNFFDIFNSIKGLLGRVSLVWLLGYFFWNGFNLIAFKALELEDAGRFMLLMSLAKVGFQIAESITQGQMTIYSNMIANGNGIKARKLFRRYRGFSFLLLIVGYVVFFVFTKIFSEISLIKKLPDSLMIISVFSYFFTLLFLTLNNNFIRCFKAEPFVLVSIFNSILVPLSFYTSLSLDFINIMIMPITVLMVSILWSKRIARDFYEKQY
ncbi:hypothetical protein [Vibrio natriegens]|uniref:hypothetical protein n=1 Tax=Vibrio natriegens TaxID=691 RepID=UPI001FBA5900|nr:hypothetical protein [Vibrio natriegens]